MFGQSPARVNAQGRDSPEGADLSLVLVLVLLFCLGLSYASLVRPYAMRSHRFHDMTEDISGLSIQFEIDLGKKANPPCREEELQRALRTQIEAEGLGCFTGHFGGNRAVYGVFWREQGDVSQDERQRVIDWISKQPISATVRISELIDFEETDVGKRLDGPSFNIDNLSDQDRILVRKERGEENGA